MELKYMKINKLKLATILATCLIAAMIACCSKYRLDEGQDHEMELQNVRHIQARVRKYVIESLKIYEHNKDANERMKGFLFAKLVLNAYDRPYQRVIDALESRHSDNIKRTKENEVQEQMKSLRSPLQAIADAYGEALEESQKHSVLIQEEIRRIQEKVRNEEGRESHSDESFNQWHLEDLADFESHLVSAYLTYALELQTQNQ